MPDVSRPLAEVDRHRVVAVTIAPSSGKDYYAELQWVTALQSGYVEFMCINLAESIYLGAKKFFKIPALAALTCPVHS